MPSCSLETQVQGSCRDAEQRADFGHPECSFRLVLHGDQGDPRQLLVGSRQPQTVQRDLPSLRKAPSKSSASLNTDVTLPGIVTRSFVVEPRVCGVIQGWLFNFGRNAVEG
jgi:hypothetical protein